MESENQQLFNFNLEDLAMDFDLSEFVTFGDHSDVKEENRSDDLERSVGSPSGSLAPTSPGSVPPTPVTILDANYEDVFLGEGSMVELRDQDQVDSQMEELLYIANQVGLTPSQSASATQTGFEADSTSFDLEQKLVFSESVIEPEAKPFTGKVKTEKSSVTSSSPHKKSKTSTKAMSISDRELIAKSVKDLNRMLQGLPKDQVLQIKQRRRTLKNRGYAANSREKRQVVKSELEQVNQCLADEVTTLRQETSLLELYNTEVAQLKNELAKVTEERDYYKRERDELAKKIEANNVFNI